jgi:hypothetical protein
VNPDASRLLGRLLSYVDELTLDEGLAARSAAATIAPTFEYIEQLPESLRVLFEKHRSILLQGLKVPAHRP